MMTVWWKFDSLIQLISVCMCMDNLFGPVCYLVIFVHTIPFSCKPVSVIAVTRLVGWLVYNDILSTVVTSRGKVKTA